MKYNGTTVPTTRDNTYNSEEIHRKDDTELFETAFNKDQKTFLTRLTGAINEIRESILRILPSVSSDDNGKVLTVVNGVWDKASSSGGVEKALCVLLHTNAETGDPYINPSYGDVFQAYKDGRYVYLIEVPYSGDYADAFCLSGITSNGEISFIRDGAVRVIDESTDYDPTLHLPWED